VDGLSAGGPGAGDGLSAAEAVPFLARLIRLDPAALVRLRPAGPGSVDLWARLPWRVLATRRVPGPSIMDITVGAAQWLRALTEGDGRLPPARDADWRWPLPPGPGTTVEVLPVAAVRRVGLAAAETLRAARGRVGDRMLRDALLDHVPIRVSTQGQQVAVRQGLVQALLRMAFDGTEDDREVAVRITGSWVGLATEGAAVWLQNSPSLTIQVTR
jgi:hypothetical protein